MSILYNLKPNQDDRLRVKRQTKYREKYHETG